MRPKTVKVPARSPGQTASERILQLKPLVGYDRAIDITFAEELEHSFQAPDQKAIRSRRKRVGTS